jgi:hypothetical protein
MFISCVVNASFFSNHLSTKKKGVTRSGGGAPVSSIGVGYNTFTSTALPSMVTLTHVDQNDQSFTKKVVVCTSVEDIYNTVEINADIAFNHLWGSFKARVEFTRSISMSSTSICILALVQLALPTQSVSGVTLNASAPLEGFSTIQQRGRLVCQLARTRRVLSSRLLSRSCRSKLL